MFSALRDCCVPLCLVCHEEPQDALLEAFDKEVMGMMQEVGVVRQCVQLEKQCGSAVVSS